MSQLQTIKFNKATLIEQTASKVTFDVDGREFFALKDKPLGGYFFISYKDTEFASDFTMVTCDDDGSNLQLHKLA